MHACRIESSPAFFGRLVCLADVGPHRWLREYNKINTKRCSHSARNGKLPLERKHHRARCSSKCSTSAAFPSTPPRQHNTSPFVTTGINKRELWERHKLLEHIHNLGSVQIATVHIFGYHHFWSHAHTKSPSYVLKSRL